MSNGWAAKAGEPPPPRAYRTPEVLPKHEPAGRRRGLARGCPPADSTYRCQQVRLNGRQCRRWAARGATRCAKHLSLPTRPGGLRVPGSPKGCRISALDEIAKRLPAVYSRYLGKKLAERLEELSGVPDELDLSNELRLMRSVAVDAAMLYSATLEIPGNDERALSARMAAGAVMKDVIDGVVTTVDRMVKVQNSRADNLNAVTLHLVVAQIVEMAYGAFGERDPGAVREFADSLKALRLPSSEVVGTSLTPDMDAAAMDDTVPSAPEELQLRVKEAS